MGVQARYRAIVGSLNTLRETRGGQGDAFVPLGAVGGGGQAAAGEGLPAGGVDEPQPVEGASRKCAAS